MKKQEEIKTILDIALLYTVITSIFSLLNKLSTLIVPQGTFVERIRLFLQRNTLWIIVVITVIIILSIYIKKSNQKVSTNIADNSIVGLVTGAFVVLEGLFNLSSSLPLNILSVESFIQASQYIDVSLDGSVERMILQAVISNALSVVIILCQIILGIYLIKVYKKRMN